MALGSGFVVLLNGFCSQFKKLLVEGSHFFGIGVVSVANFGKIFESFSFLNFEYDGFEQILMAIGIDPQLLLYFLEVLGGEVVDIFESRVIVHRIPMCYLLSL